MDNAGSLTFPTSVSPAGSGSGTGTPISRVPVPALFWLALLALIANIVVRPGQGGSISLMGAAVVMLLGGLPHGAFDIAIARQTLRLGPLHAAMLFFAYVAVALAMALLWIFAPLVALTVFLILAAVHFGEDWLMLDVGLLRIMAGASIICTPAFFRTADVATLFIAMAGPEARILASLAVACTPVVLMVTAVGTAMAWISGHREWATAQTAALLVLALCPPQIGFALYFVFLHSPLHMAGLTKALPGWPRARTCVYGTIICGVTLSLAAMIAPGFTAGSATALTSDSFRLLAVVAAPHLLLTSLLKRRSVGA